MRETETAIIERIKTDVKWEEWKEQVNSQITSGLTEKLYDEQEHSVVPVNVPELKVSSKIHIEKNGLSITLPSDISPETLTALVHELCLMILRQGYRYILSQDIPT